MLTPEQYTIIADSMTGLLQDLEDFIIQDFVRRVTTAGTITETAKWQLLRAKEMGLSTQAIRKAVKDALQMSDQQLDYLFELWGTEALKAENTVLNTMGKEAVDIYANEELNQIFEAVKAQTKGEINNITQSLGFAKREGGKIVFNEMAKYFQDQMDFVQAQVMTGALDYNSAIRQTVKRMADSGLRTVDYATGWQNNLDVAVRRATLTGANQLSGQMTDALGEEMGCNYVEVTAHAGARNTGDGAENHKGWQGKVYCRKGCTEEYPNLAQATGFGTGSGLKGWNCRHDYNNFYPGFSTRAWTDDELEDIDPPPFTYKGKTYDFYQANQRQREIERSIRRSKRELIGHKESKDEEAFTIESIRLQRQKQEYKSFSEAAGLRMKPERQQVYDFGKGISQKAVNASKEGLHQQYKPYFGTKTKKETMEKLKKIEYNKEKWLLDGYVKAVKKGDISALTGIDNYLETARKIKAEIVGMKTGEGIEITGFMSHFVDRVIGQQASDASPKKGFRQGVSIEDVKDALLTSKTSIRKHKTGKISQQHGGNNCYVIINPDTGTLIQTNPRGGKIK